MSVKDSRMGEKSGEQRFLYRMIAEFENQYGSLACFYGGPYGHLGTVHNGLLKEFK